MIDFKHLNNKYGLEAARSSFSFDCDYRFVITASPATSATEQLPYAVDYAFVTVYRLSTCIEFCDISIVKQYPFSRSTSVLL